MYEHIAFFTPSLNGGGSERVILNVANGFATRGYQVDVVLVTGRGDFLADLDSRIRIINLNKERVFFSVLPLIQYLRAQRPSALLSTQLHSNVVALLAALFSRANVKVIIREVTAPNREKARRRTLSSVVLDYLARRLYGRAHRIIAVCNDMKPQIVMNRSVSAEKVEVIYNPVPIDKIRSLAESESMYAWLNEGRVPTVVSIGRLERVKDFATLIHSFRLVRNKVPARLIILGEGRLRKKLTDLVNSLSLGDDVFLPGFVENPYSYLGRASVVVLSSRWEGLPNVLLEALALDVQIVSTDCETGPREILRDGRDGILVPVGDSEGLAGGILRCLGNDSPHSTDPESVNRFEFGRVLQQYVDIVTC